MVDLKQWLISRGYQREMVDTQIDKAHLYDRDTLLSEVRPRMQSSDKVFLVITYHPALSKVMQSIKKFLGHYLWSLFGGLKRLKTFW